MLSTARRWTAITTTATIATVTLALAATATTGDDVAPTPDAGSPSCTGPAAAVPDEHAVLLTNDGALPLSAHERTVVVVAPPADDAAAPLPTVDAVLTELLGRNVPSVTADALLSADDGLTRAPDAADEDAAPIAVVVLGDPSTEDGADGADGPADVPTGLEDLAALDVAGWDVAVAGPREEVLADLAAAGPDGATALLEHASAALALGDLPDADAEPSGDLEPDGAADTDTGTDTGTERLAGLLVGERAPTGLLTEPVPAPDPGGATAPEPGVLLETGHGLRYAAADLDDATPGVVEPDGSVLHVDLVGTGTAPGAVPVHVDARDGDTWTELACAVVDLEPGAVVSTTVPLPAAPEAREARVRTATDVVELSLPAREPTDEAGDDGAADRTDEPDPAPTEAPGQKAAQAPTAKPTADDTPRPSRERDGAPTDEDAPPVPTTPESRTDASIPLHARIPTTPSAPGALRLTIDDGAAQLGEPRRLDDRWHLTGSLPTVTVEDDRAHAAGWTVSVQGTGLTGASGTLGAERLGWAPTAPVRHGLAVGPDVASVLSGGPGLAEPAVLATARGAARHGPVDLGARLDLEAPLDTPPGDYAGTLTVTLFPVD